MSIRRPFRHLGLRAALAVLVGVTLSLGAAPALFAPASAAGNSCSLGSPSSGSSTFTVGSSGSVSGSASCSNGHSPSLTLSHGTLPSGLGLSGGSGHWVISGTPAAGTAGSYPVTIQASYSNYTPDTQNVTITVNPANQAPAITSADHTSFTSGSTGTFTVTTTGYPTPSLSVSGDSLPPSLHFHDNGDGTATLSGNSSVVKVYNLTIRASNGVGSAATQSFTLTVNAATVAPSFTSGSSTTFTVGSSGSFTVSASGVPAPSISKSGTLPSGVSLTDNGNGTATLSGTPAAGTGGSYPFTITASNGVSPNATQHFTLTVNQAPAITSDSSTTYTVGQYKQFNVTTSGSPSVTSINETGPLPNGIAFHHVSGSNTAYFSGAPSSGTGGVYAITITVSNGVDPDATQSLALVVDEAPAITSAASTTFTVGSPGSFTVHTSGYPTAGLSKSGTLPDGVSLTDNGNGTATLSGTPAAGTGGSYPITITASDGVSPDATQHFTLTVKQGPAITSAASTTFTVGSSGSFTVHTSGYPTASLSKSGTLPSGVSFHDNGNGTATLSGTPAAGTGGSYPITITASNGVSPDATQSFTLTVDQAPAITSGSSTTFTVGTSGTFSVTSTGYPTASLSTSGTLPAALVHDSGNGTGTLSGTPMPGTGGVYTFTITASNGVNPHATQSFTLTVDQAPAITSGSSTTFQVGHNGSFTVTSTGYPHASLSESATLPSGVSLHDNGNGTATLSGTPAVGTGGVYIFTITGSNGVGSNATQSFTLTVDEAPAVTSAAAATFQAAQSSNFTVTTWGYPRPTIAEAGKLPIGLSFHDNGNGTASIYGTPLYWATGTYPITITADNGDGPEATQQFVLSVVSPPTITSVDNVQTWEGATADFQVTTSGFPAPALSLTGALPNGLSFTDNGDGTGTISGVPASGQTGSYNVTVQATNGVGPDATQSVVLTVAAKTGPQMTATVSGPDGESANPNDWYDGPVTVTFHCAVQTFPLTGPCPDPVVLSTDGAEQSVTRTITDTMGNAATVTQAHINIDATAPAVTVTGVKSGAVYDGSAPKAMCTATDALSGVTDAGCTVAVSSKAITGHGVVGQTVTYTATATDKAGNVGTSSGTYTVLTTWVKGATYSGGQFHLTPGKTYTFVVQGGSTSPRYYTPVASPGLPKHSAKHPGQAMSHHGSTWTHTVTISKAAAKKHSVWNLLVKVGSSYRTIALKS